jgi:hypothetical protein
LKTYYTYLWLREDGTPYYVGKGSGKRAFEKHDKLTPPPDSARILIEYYSIESEAYEAEAFLVQFYGRKDLKTGCLRNMSDGGRGGLNPSKETREKQRAAKLRYHPRYWLGKKRPGNGRNLLEIPPKQRSENAKNAKAHVIRTERPTVAEKLKNTIWITDGVKSRQIKQDDKELPTGWRLGMAKTPRDSEKYVTNGIITKRIKEGTPLPEGWRFGMKPRLVA